MIRKMPSETAHSAINAENQQIEKQAPNFTPKNVKLGVFVLFKKLRGTLAMKSNIATHSMWLAISQKVGMVGRWRVRGQALR